MKTALKNIIEVLEGALRVRKLTFIEAAILNEATEGLKKESFTREEVTNLLHGQKNRAVNSIARMGYSTRSDSGIMKKLRNVKLIKF